jgi:hypothetical protein
VALSFAATAFAESATKYHHGRGAFSEAKRYSDMDAFLDLILGFAGLAFLALGIIATLMAVVVVVMDGVSYVRRSSS